MINPTPIPYKLEKHLQEICMEHAEYEDLQSVWHINKKACRDLLSNVLLNYPHYTIHDISHSESIITNIEMLLGEESIRKLSPTDTWLLLQAAYLHDFGMVLLHQDMEKQWGSEEFRAYLESLRNSSDPSLKQAIGYLDSLGGRLSSEECEPSWPLKVRKNVTWIMADYYRRRHASVSKKYISRLAREWGLDLSFNGLIPQRLTALLGELAYLHTADSGEVLKLDYVSNGFNADYIHPRFAAQMLRMGDLLDADNNRFNPYTEKVSGESPASSRVHIKKHLSARHLLITPEAIEYRADCPDEETYRETRTFLDWLRQETEFLALNWLDIMPRGLNGTAPRLRKTELLLRGVPDEAGLSDLRFSISQEKAFDVIEGSNLYSDRLIFIREIIQNALDACKLQLWEDITDQKYNAWISGAWEEGLNPFDIDQKIFENYKVQVELLEADDHTVEVVVRDCGIGISAETFKRLCQVGTSYEGDEERKREIGRMPAWLRPTAGFGIGLQSIFLMTDQFEIYSNFHGKGIHAVVGSRRLNGYVQIHESDYLKCRGTELHVKLKKAMKFSYTLGGKAYDYVCKAYDPFADQGRLLQYKLLDVISENCSETYFPIEVLFDGTVMAEIKPYVWDRPSETIGKYRYKWLDGHRGMEIWDNENYAMLSYWLMPDFVHYGETYRFKGMEINHRKRFFYRGISFVADLYGLNTRDSITLDRKELKTECAAQVNQIVEDGLIFFTEQIWRELEKEKELKADFWGQDRRVTLYSYWCRVLPEQKRHLLDRWGKELEEVPIWVFRRDDQGGYRREQVDFQDIMREIENTACPNLEEWLSYEREEQNVRQLEQIQGILNAKGERLQYTYILAEKNFIEILDTFPRRELAVLRGGKEQDLILTSYSYEENPVLDPIDEETGAYVLELLTKEGTSGRIRGFFPQAVRRFIPAVKEYAPLAVKTVPFGMAGWLIGSSAFILSPVTASDLENLPLLKKEAFIKEIVTRADYKKLVSYVYDQQIQKERYTKEELDTHYRALIGDYYEQRQAGEDGCSGDSSDGRRIRSTPGGRV